MTLLPGDVISTGTPSGVGLGFNPPRYLQPGDHVELGITVEQHQTAAFTFNQKRKLILALIRRL